MNFVASFLVPFIWVKSVFSKKFDIWIFDSRVKLTFISVGILFCSACSNDDGFTEEEVSQIPSFELIGIDLQSTYQYSYDGSSEMGSQINLTEELGVPANFLTLRQVGSTLSFYSFASGTFSLFQKDVLSGASNSYPEFYSNTSERSIVWGTNDEESVFFGFYNPRGSTNLAIRKLTLDNLEGADLNIEFNIDQLFQPLYEDGKLFVTYRTFDLRYKIAVYNTDSGALIQTIDYGTASPSILIDNNGNLAVFRFTEDNGTILEKRDFVTLSIIEEIPLAFKQKLPLGPVNGSLIGNNLYYEFVYQQPSAINSGPAIFDVASEENRVLDLIGIKNRLENEENIVINELLSQYDEDEGIFLISYVQVNTEDILQGGVLAISEEGELLTNLQLPFIPAYFIQ